MGGVDANCAGAGLRALGGRAARGRCGCRCTHRAFLHHPTCLPALPYVPSYTALHYATLTYYPTQPYIHRVVRINAHSPCGESYRSFGEGCPKHKHKHKRGADGAERTAVQVCRAAAALFFPFAFLLVRALGWAARGGRRRRQRGPFSSSSSMAVAAAGSETGRAMGDGRGLGSGWAGRGLGRARQVAARPSPPDAPPVGTSSLSEKPCGRFRSTGTQCALTAGGLPRASGPSFSNQGWAACRCLLFARHAHRNSPHTRSLLCVA